MADTDFIDSDVMKGHFAEAGIADTPADAAATTTTADVTATPGEGDANGTTETTETTKTDANSGDTKPAAVAKDSSSVGTDDSTKSGKADEGQKSRGPKDLTLADGTVVKSGPERRWYETAQLAKQQAAAAGERIATMQRELDTAKQTANAHQTAITALGGKDPTTVTNALRLMSDLSTNPVATVTKLLAELKDLGHSVEGIGGQVDTLAIQRDIARQFAEGQRQQGPTQEQINDNARVETGQFFARYPDAVMHDDVLADIITKHPNVSLDAAYFQLKQACIEQGYDWDRPLPAQVAARGTQGAAQVATPSPAPAPMVNGRGADTAVINPINPANNEPDGQTFDDIIRSAMKETGYKAPHQ